MAKRSVMLSLLGVGIALTAASSRARADFQTPTYEYKTKNLNTNWGYDPATSINTAPGTLWSIYSGPGPVANPLLLRQFNPNDPAMVAPHASNLTAVLTGVNITASYALNNELQYVYITPNTSESVRAQGALSIGLPSSTALTFPVAPVFKDGYNPDGTPLYRAFNPATDALNTPINVPVTSPSSFVTHFFASNGHDAVSAQYVGTANVAVPIVASAVSSFDVNSGNGYGRSITLAQLDLQVSYSYQLVSVPEPSSVVLTALGGMVSIWAFRRRRRSRT